MLFQLIEYSTKFRGGGAVMMSGKLEMTIIIIITITIIIIVVLVIIVINVTETLAF